MFDGLRKKMSERRNARKRSEFDRAAAETGPSEVTDHGRSRDLPDSLGDFNEMQRMGPTIGGTGSTGV